MTDETSDAWVLVLAGGLGILSGYVEVTVGDVLLTSFLALAFTMLLGLLRPCIPWRWALVICTCVPLARVFATTVLHQYTQRAQIYEAFLVFLPGMVGAYAGHFLRGVLNSILGRK
jgi:hypothetical protein